MALKATTSIHSFYLGVTVHLGFSFQRRQCSLMVSTRDSGSSSPSLCAGQDCCVTLCNIFSQCLSSGRRLTYLFHYNQYSFGIFMLLLLQGTTTLIYKLFFFSCRMANFCSKHLGLLAHQVVGEERLSFISTLLGNSWKQLIPAVTLDIA